MCPCGTPAAALGVQVRTREPLVLGLAAGCSPGRLFDPWDPSMSIGRKVGTPPS